MSYKITRHALIRYRQRVNPSLKSGICREFTERLKAGRAVERPEWASPVARGATYVLLDDDTAAVLDGRVVLTVVTRQSAAELVRRRCKEAGWTRGSREPAAA